MTIKIKITNQDPPGGELRYITIEPEGCKTSIYTTALLPGESLETHVWDTQAIVIRESKEPLK